MQFCNLDGITDYCYKGRVEDELLHQPILDFGEVYHGYPCSISIGTGFYYTRSVLLDKAHLDSIQRDALTIPYSKPLSAQQNNFLGRLLRSYDDPNLNTLHFTNRRYLDDNTLIKSEYLALQKPEIDIDMPYMHFPGTRFASMGKMVGDFEHPTWRAKPWDDKHSTFCGISSLPCTIEPTQLNYELVENTNGDFVLSFDDEPYVASGNGLEPDVPNMDDHLLPTGHMFSDDDVIHAVYMNDADGHPAITLDNTRSCEITGTEAESGEGELENNSLILVDIPLFSSAGECVTEGYLDFCDGYASKLGYQPVDDLDLDRDGLYKEFFDAAEIPHDTIGTGTEALFFLISGIRVGQGVRLSCGCSVVQCDDATGTEFTGQPESRILECSADHYLDEDGQYDFNSDHLTIESTLVADDKIGVYCNKLDGSIPSMFELV